MDREIQKKVRIEELVGRWRVIYDCTYIDNIYDSMEYLCLVCYKYVCMSSDVFLSFVLCLFVCLFVPTWRPSTAGGWLEGWIQEI
jgi:hypothetical protein